MAAKPETRFRLKVERLLPSSIHYEKMANPFCGGTADSWYSGNGGDLWVEYKFLPCVPQRGVITAKRLGLTMLQLLWLKGRYEEGRNVAVVVGVPGGGVILRDLEWEEELSPLFFSKRIKGVSEIADWIVQQTQRME